MDVPLAADEQAAKLQYLTLDPSTGMASLGDDAVPGQISAGYVRVSDLTDTNATAGNARARVAWGFAVHSNPSTIANDTPATADVAKPIFLAPDNTPGLLSHTGTVAGSNLKNRSLLGLALGKVKEGSAAIYHWVGPIAQAVARAVMVADGYVGGSLAKAIDAGATTDLSETLLDNVTGLHGKVASVRFIVSGSTLAASGTTNYKTMRLWKRPASGGTAVLVASADTQTTAWTQWETVTFTLSAVAGAVDKLETDVFTVDESHAASGAIIPAGKLVVDMKVG
jgi:hypothetical protein